MESIQLAQMLADLSDLNAAQEAQAALALVNANKTLPPPPDPVKAPEQRNHQRVASASATIIQRTASPAKFDKFGRRILTPPMTRTNSAQGLVSGTTTPQPRGGSEQPEDDVTRATSLMQLYEIRAKLRQQDNTSLNKARERIAAIHARHQQGTATPTGERKNTPDFHQSRFAFPKTS